MQSKHKDTQGDSGNSGEWGDSSEFNYSRANAITLKLNKQSCIFHFGTFKLVHSE